jgi:hypothetical protein
MKQQTRVESVQEFKLRIAAIIRTEPEQIPTPPRSQRVKLAANRKRKRRTRRCTFTKSARKNKRGVNLICEALPFSRLWYDKAGTCHETPSLHERLQSLTPIVIRVYDAAGT